jgi:16S rRNA (adenine1518-N6/adenine1519-N6)-dimethyltransferase
MHIRRVLRKWNLRPDKSLGQNFLVDDAVLQRIADAAEPTPQDVVLEIGAGTGALTRHLARRAGRVVAIELDQQLVPVLESELAELDNVAVVHGDILELNPARLIEEAERKLDVTEARYKVVGNLPYYITSAILRHLLEAERRPELMVVTVQYEVAKRIVAEPGDMSVLAVSVRFYGDAELLFRIKSGSFYPVPAVDSGVVRVDVHDTPPLPDERAEAFFQVVRAGFSQRRKQLHNAISAGMGEQISKDEAATRLEDAGVDHRRRAQTLTVEEWIAVTEALNDYVVTS